MVKWGYVIKLEKSNELNAEGYSWYLVWSQ